MRCSFTLSLRVAIGLGLVACSSTKGMPSTDTASSGAGTSSGTTSGVGGSTPSTDTASSGASTSSGTTSGVGGSTASAATTSASSTGSGAGGGGPGPKAPLHFVGRFDFSNPNAPAFGWPGSAIHTRFTGTGIDVKLHDSGTNFFVAVVDGTVSTVIATKGDKDTYTLASGLADAEHDIYIEKRTESYVGTVQFQGFKPASGKPLVETPEPFHRGIELVGDSITCGYGNEGQGPTCGFTPDTENEFVAYGALAARALNAAHVSISYSGIGMYRDFQGSTQDQMPIKFERTIADDPGHAWGFTWTPDVVVINLGTNDFAKGDPGQPYVDAYLAFMKKVRSHYPSAFIICAVGSMLSDAYPAGEMRLTKAKQYVQTVISTVKGGGDDKVSFADLGEQSPTDGYGCDYHPSIKTNMLMADKLTAAIKQVTGW